MSAWDSLGSEQDVVSLKDGDDFASVLSWEVNDCFEPHAVWQGSWRRTKKSPGDRGWEEERERNSTVQS